LSIILYTPKTRKEACTFAFSVKLISTFFFCKIQNYVLRWLASATARARSIFSVEKMRAPKNIILNYFLKKEKHKIYSVPENAKY